jgi:hypothetical protein
MRRVWLVLMCLFFAGALLAQDNPIQFLDITKLELGQEGQLGKLDQKKKVVYTEFVVLTIVNDREMLLGTLPVVKTVNGKQVTVQDRIVISGLPTKNIAKGQQLKFPEKNFEVTGKRKSPDVDIYYVLRPRSD